MLLIIETSSRLEGMRSFKLGRGAHPTSSTEALAMNFSQDDDA